MKNKVFKTCSEAVADIPDGAVIMVGGFGHAADKPQKLIQALRDQDPVAYGEGYTPGAPWCWWRKRKLRSRVPKQGTWDARRVGRSIRRVIGS